MRILTSSIVVPLTMLMVVSAAAQTNTFPASGNVGIGTTTPDDTPHTLASCFPQHSNDREFQPQITTRCLAL
jgi:hypothetical protein